ncbi:MAG: hypothetical protein N2508_10035, partial [Anaerolineae bacterium]|nr:hypothetical protein [Anaerolineae bacterium]
MQVQDTDVPQSRESSSTDLPIAELKLPTRIHNLLLGAGFSTVGDVLAALQRSEDELLGIKGFGPKSLATLKARLEESGLLAPAPPAAPPPVPPPQVETPSQTEYEYAPALVPAPDITSAEAVLPWEGLGTIIAQVRDRLRSRFLVAGLIAVAVVLLLFLLIRPVFTGYETLDATRSSVSHPDGVTLRVDKTFTGRLRVRLSSVPRLNLLEGSAGRELRRAVEALPTYLTVKSPLYQLRARGKATQPV